MPHNIDLIIEPKERDLGDFTVKRVLPFPKKRAVGPFIFFDHMGPVDFKPGIGIDVRPHPHIGLATVTYLFSGEITHRVAVSQGAFACMLGGSALDTLFILTAPSSDPETCTRERGGRVEYWQAPPPGAGHP